MAEETPPKHVYISLQEAAKYCPYSQEYLSLRARQKKLRAVKLGRNWVTTKEWVEDYVRGAAEEYIHISLYEAAKYCPYSQEYLSLRARQKKLRAVKLGRNWVTTKEWVEDYVRGAAEYNNKIKKVLPEPPDNLPIEPFAPPLTPPPKSKKKIVFFPLPELSLALRSGFLLILTLVLIFAGIFFGRENLKTVYQNIAPINSALKAPLDNLARELSGVAKNISSALLPDRVNNFFEEKLPQVSVAVISPISDFFQTAKNFFSGTIKNFSFVFSREIKKIKEISRFVIQSFKEKKSPQPIFTSKEQQEKMAELENQLRELKEKGIPAKEITKEVEVSRVIRIEPQREITKEFIRIDDTAFSQLQRQAIEIEKLKQRSVSVERGVVNVQHTAERAIYYPSTPIPPVTMGALYVDYDGLIVSGSGVFNSPGSTALSVGGNAVVSGNVTIGGNLTVTGAIIGASIAPGNITLTDDQWVGLGAAAGRIIFDDQATDEIEITSANVGIGTTGPASKLDILGTGTFGAAGVSALTSEAHTVTLSGADPTTYATFYGNQLGAITLAGTNANQTVTDAATLSITGAPVKSTNVTLTNTYALKIAAGAVSTATNAYGLYVDAPTGATNNYGAVFATGNVGIGTTSPGALLDVGLAGTTLGVIRLEGSTSGYAALQPTAAAGNVTITFPAATGTVALGTGTANQLAYWSGTNTVAALGAMTDGQLAIGSTGATPVIATLIGTANEIDITNGAGSITIGIVDPLIVAKGGTGAATFTANGVLYGNTTSALGVTAAGTTGQVLIATTGAAPRWGTIAASGVTDDSLDFAQFEDTLDLDANLTVNQTTYTWTQNFTGTTTTGLTYNANSLTTGTAFSIASTSTAGGASASSMVLNISRSGTNASASHTAYGIYSSVTNTGTTSTNVGLYVTASGASNNYAAIFDAGNVGIGTTTPRTELELGGDGAILAIGTYGSGWTEPSIGAGTRMLWYPRKAAFRAGYVSGTQWGDASIGDGSVAMGFSNTASGLVSFAMGNVVIASGDYSVAMGRFITAGSAANTIALGQGVNSGSPLVNNTARSLMIGFNSTSPTLTVRGLETSGSPTLLTITGQAHTTLTASTEASDINFNLARTVQFATGALATQRAIQISAPTYDFVAASTLTDATTLAISGAPVKGTNTTLTNTYALKIAAGAVGAATNAYGLYVDAPTGATNNYGAVFATGNVGIGTTGPDGKLDVLSATEQLRLTYTDGAVYSSFTTNSVGDLTITATGGDISFDNENLTTTGIITGAGVVLSGTQAIDLTNTSLVYIRGKNNVGALVNIIYWDPTQNTIDLLFPIYTISNITMSDVTFDPSGISTTDPDRSYTITAGINTGSINLNAGTAGGIVANKTITAPNFISNVVTGTQPYATTSTTLNTNLNADLLDGYHAVSLTDGRLLRYNSTGTKIENATVTETAGALGGITTLSMSGQLTNTLVIGTAPFVITSTTQVDNLNVQYLTGKTVGTSGNTIPLLDGTNTWSGTQKINVNSATALFVEQDGVKDNTFVVDTATPLVSVTVDGIGSTATKGLVVQNTTAATSGLGQKTPMIVMKGRGWQSSADNSYEWGFDSNPNSVVNSIFYLKFSNNGGAWSTIAAWDAYGYFQSPFSRNVWGIGSSITSTAAKVMDVINSKDATVSQNEYGGFTNWASKGWKTAATAGAQYMGHKMVHATETGVISPIGVVKWLYKINGNDVTNETLELFRMQWGSDAGVIGATFNDRSINGYVFRIEGDTDANLINANAVADNVGIGTATPSNKLDVNGGIRVATLAAASATHVCRDGSNDLSTCSADISEYTPTLDDVETGDLVVVSKDKKNPTDDPDAPFLLEKSNTTYQDNIVGAIADIEEGASLGEKKAEHYKPLVIGGRVPVKVSTENGSVEPGDWLTSSTLPGTAMKATTPGSVIGKALESSPTSGVGKIMVFVNLGWYGGSLSASGTIEDEPITPPEASFVQKVKDALSYLGLTIENGIMSLKELVAEKITTKVARIEKMEMVDKATGEIYCAWIENGEWQKANGECSSVTPEPPVEPPIEPPVEPPIEPPVEPPVEPPIEPPIEPPVEPPVEPQPESEIVPEPEPQPEPASEPQPEPAPAPTPAE